MKIKMLMLGIFLSVISLLQSCTDTQQNPFTDPNNLSFDISILNTPAQRTVNDSIVVSVSVNIVSMIEWMSLSFGDGDSLSLAKSAFTVFGNDTVRHIYKTPGNYSISGTVHMSVGGTKANMPLSLKVSGISPVITKISDTIKTINAGGNIGFPITVTGTKPISYVWYHGSDSVKNSEVYSVNNAKMADSGFYYCVASNEWGKDTSERIHVEIKIIPTAAPAISSTIAGDGKVTVLWSPITGATSYNLYYAVGKTVDKNGTRVLGVASPKEIIGLANGTQFAFAISSVNEGGESVLSSVQTAMPQIPVAGAPTISSVTPSSGKVTVSWDAVAGAMSYNLYYKAGTSVDKSSNKLTGVTSPRVVDSLINGTQYAIAVSVVNAGGESGLSTVQLATPQVPAPGTTAITAASAGNAKVTITWDPVAGATSYNLYYAASTTVDKSGTKVPGVVSPKEISGLTNGTKYAFAVSVVNAGGESALSAVQVATPLLPVAGVPDIDSTSVLDGKVILFWKNVTNATSYNLYYAVGDSVDKSKAKVVGVKSPDTVGSLSNGTKYAFALSAVSEGGESGLSSVKVATPILPPSVPVISVITGDDGKVLVTWISVLNATSYNLYYSKDSTVNKKSSKITGIVSSFAGAEIAMNTFVSDLINGNLYAFAITAVNGGYESELSTVRYAKPHLPLADIPNIVFVTPGDAVVSITWGNLTSATSYKIYYDTGSIVTKTSKSLTSTTNSIVITGLINDTKYSFAVSSINKSGESDLSAISLGTPELFLPDPPSIDSVGVGNGYFQVYWKPANGASSYNIYYDTTTSSNQSYVITTPTVIDVKSPYKVLGLSTEVRYYFYLCSVNAKGVTWEKGLGHVKTF